MRKIQRSFSTGTDTTPFHEWDKDAREKILFRMVEGTTAMVSLQLLLSAIRSPQYSSPCIRLTVIIHPDLHAIFHGFF